MRELWIDRDGARLFAVEEGEGPLIVMLHGGMADHRTALPIVASLSERYRVVAPDLRASGRSWWGGELSFDQLADDMEHLLNVLGADRAVVGGVSGGAGVALRFAFRHAGRTLGLVMAKPMYAGESLGYSEFQRTSFAGMDALASRAATEGVKVVRPLYENLPARVREGALAMIEGFDPASVVATSRFLASGAQPFSSVAELARLEPPVLLVRGDDPMHPAQVSDLYAANIPDCTTLEASTTDIATAIGAFTERCLRAAA